MKYASITSVDVEKLFPMYTNVLAYHIIIG